MLYRHGYEDNACHGGYKVNISKMGIGHGFKFAIAGSLRNMGCLKKRGNW